MAIKSPATDDLGAEIDKINATLAEHEARLDALEAADGGGGTDPVPPEPPEPSGDWPNASNSGSSGTLSAYTGSMSIGSNTTIENKTFPAGSSLRCQGTGIVIRNCKLETGATWGIDADGCDGILIERVTIVGKKGSQNSCILSGRNAKIKKCDLSRFENAITLQDGACLVEACFIHDLGGGPEAHVDGISIQGGQNGTTVRGCHIESFDTSCVFVKCDFGPISNTTIDGNRLINFPGKKCAYTVYSVRGNSGQTPTGTKITNNTLEKGNWGYWSLEGSVTKSGNTDYSSGNNIDQQSVTMSKEGQEAAESRTVASAKALGKKGK